jgi:hypothetical protein
MAVALSENAGPQTVAEIERIYNSVWAQAHAGAERRRVDVEERREPLDLVPGKRFCFRTRPGGPRRPLVTIDAPDMDWDLEDESTKKGKAYAILRRKWEKRNGADPEWKATVLQALEDNHGRIHIEFQPIDSNLEAWFQTDSPAIAAVIRRYIKSADQNARFFYEVFADREILVGERRFPDTPTGTQAALAFMAETGGDLKYVQKGTKKPYKAVD